MTLFFLFCAQLPAMAEDTTSAILIEKAGDIIKYLADAEPVEVDARTDDFRFTCTIMPEDSFRIERIYFNSFEETAIRIKKMGGTPGNQEICPTKSDFFVTGTREVIKTKEGVPKREHIVSLPFVPSPEELRRIQARKNQPKISTTETILFKKGDRFQRSLDAEPVEVEAHVNRLDFRRCEKIS